MELVTQTSERAIQPPVEDYLTPEQAAAKLQINEQTVRKFLRSGELRGSYIGRVWRIPESALIEWLESKQNRPPTKSKAKK